MALSRAIDDDLLRRTGNPRAALERLIFQRIFADESKRDEYLLAAFFDFAHPLTSLWRDLALDERRLLFQSIRTNHHRLRHLFRIIAPRPTEFIADIGCGVGGLVFHLASVGARVVGVDPARESLEQGRRLIARLGGTVPLAAGVCQSIPLATSSADKIVCANVFEHLHEKEVAIGEFRRVLKPGGRLFIYTDNLSHVLLRSWVRQLQKFFTSRCLTRWRVGFSGEAGGHVALIAPGALVEMLRALNFGTRVVYSMPAWPVAGCLASRFFCIVARK